MLKKLLAVLLLLAMLPLSAFAEGAASYSRIELGAYGDEVEAVQLRLKELGYLNGEVDGSYWTQTKRAMMKFQQTNYIPVTEEYFDEQAQEVLFSEDAQPAYEVVAKLGEKSAEIELMQQCLYEWGFSTEEPDGVFGTGTAAALAEFQDTIWSRIWNERNPGLSYMESGFVVDGNSVDSFIFRHFTDRNYTIYYTDLKLGDKGPDVGRIQNLLYKNNYLWREPDNSFDYFTQAAVIAFQKAHDLPATGIADEATQKRLMAEGVVPCEEVALPYRLVVDVDQQKVFAYAWDGEGYTSLVREMICSTGTVETPTPVGVYSEKTGPLNVWHKFRVYHCWAQYSYVIEGGIMFHSVLYYNRVNEETGEETPGYLDKASVENLGTRQSHGCVRLEVEDAKWIYLNCPRNTEVEIIQLVPDPVLPAEE
ncbi:MAG: peptidoglycan-binding protein [Eubacteriales bacterium]|nr:peptidoglycan-binding protein [Eubacteriales bacterium]